MAMQICPDCHGPISSSAPSCPTCGWKRIRINPGHGYGTAAILLALFAPFGGILGIIFGAVSISKSKNAGMRTAGSATAAIIVGIVTTLVWTLIMSM